ncbi:MAG TPA: hypothetical protein VN026_17935 [Bacteroidia bacterium]|jgi:hypothetical protein|nr:hypothetical protein [Bacteroidia bacterium]
MPLSQEKLKEMIEATHFNHLNKKINVLKVSPLYLSWQNRSFLFKYDGSEEIYKGYCLLHEPKEMIMLGTSVEPANINTELSKDDVAPTLRN